MNGTFSLDGRVAIVTGALGKLGPCWIDGLLQAGATVVGIDLPAARPPDAFESLREQFNGRLHLYRADICDRASLDEARRRCSAELGVAAILVNNAGIDQPPSAATGRHLVTDIPPEIFRETVEVNLVGTFQAIQAFGGDMVKARGGSIINIGSLYAGVAPDPHFYDHIPGDPPFLKPPAYGASKAAVVNLTRYFATLWGPSGVRVNALSPGGVLGDQDNEFKRKFCARVPLGRMAAPGDLIGPLVFLASDASAYVTGIELRVDGGFTAW